MVCDWIVSTIHAQGDGFNPKTRFPASKRWPGHPLPSPQLITTPFKSPSRLGPAHVWFALWITKSKRMGVKYLYTLSFFHGSIHVRVKLFAGRGRWNSKFFGLSQIFEKNRQKWPKMVVCCQFFLPVLQILIFHAIFSILPLFPIFYSQHFPTQFLLGMREEATMYAWV